MKVLFSSLIWDPPATLFQIPYINLEVRIYGLLFAFGFLFGYYLMSSRLEKFLKNQGDPRSKETSKMLTDQITSFSVVGCILGARLGHVLFYDTAYYWAYPWKMIAFWEGGLASHGGAVGVLLAFTFFWKIYRKEMFQISFLKLFDLFVVPVALAGFFIRLGNFFNQEILGTYTSMPWGVVFPHAIDGGNNFPRHPAQLYEGVFYLAVFFTLRKLTKFNFKEGFMSGLFLILVFLSRFIFEFFKSSQDGLFDNRVLQTGQLLSLPFIFVGFWLVFDLQTYLKSFSAAKR